MYGVVNLKRWLRVTAAAVLAVGVLGVFGALLRVFAADSGVQLQVACTTRSSTTAGGSGST